MAAQDNYLKELRQEWNERKETISNGVMQDVNYDFESMLSEYGKGDVINKIERARKLEGEIKRDFPDLGLNLKEIDRDTVNAQSAEVKERLAAYLDAVKARRNAESTDFLLDLCNVTKTKLMLLNFGSVSDGDLTATKEKILCAVDKILRYVEPAEYDCDGDYGYDLSPYLKSDECQAIFGGGRAFVNSTMANVFTVLVYLRRAYKRVGIFEEKDLEKFNISARMVSTMREIMGKWYSYAANPKSDYRFTGWGFTTESEKPNLCDTFTVIEAISRFEDAFDKSGAKRDDEFLRMLNIGEDGKDYNYSGAVMETMYKVGKNLYSQAKEVYGSGAYYWNGNRYVTMSYEEIASSNRSSALFNPLYLAMITMYAYTDKEVVISHFIDDKNSANKYVARYGEEMKAYLADYLGKPEILHEPIERTLELVLTGDRDVSDGLSEDYGNKSWREYYKQARYIQKFIEAKHPEELNNVKAYRDYLNDTKDTIDQVNILYRKFKESQRLGVVDTDYRMFSVADYRNGEAAHLSRLNKLNFASVFLRPLLLSSKIMIVNALLKYPQSEMASLYDEIINSTLRETLSSRKAKNRGSDKVWLWNEDGKDYYATAKNSEAIVYDYFDYYERYELVLSISKNISKLMADAIAASPDDWASGTGDFKKNLEKGIDNAVLDENARRAYVDISDLITYQTEQNLEKLKVKYERNLEEEKKKVEEEKRLLAEREEKARRELAQKHEEQLKVAGEFSDGLKKDIGALKKENEIATVLKEMIEKTVRSYIYEMFGLITLDNINNISDKIRRFRGDDQLTNDKSLTANWQETDYAFGKIAVYRQECGSEEALKDKLAERIGEARSIKDAIERAMLTTEILQDSRSEVDKDKMEIDDKNRAVADKVERFRREKRDFENKWFSNAKNEEDYGGGIMEQIIDNAKKQ